MSSFLNLTLYVTVLCINLSLSSTDWVHSPFLNEAIKEVIKCYNLDGLGISIVQNDNILYQQTFGYSDFFLNIPFSKNKTKLLVASLSKTFSSVLINYLSIIEKFEMNASINSILSKEKKITFMTSYRTNMTTFEDLLAHRMAVNRYDFAMLFGELEASKLLERMRFIPSMRDKEFRSKFMYSNIMYVAAEKIMEVHLGRSFRDMMNRSIFSLLNMSNTSLMTKSMDLTFLAKSSTIYVNQSLRWDVFASSANVLSACGVITNLEDMGRWQIFLTNDKSSAEKELLRKALQMTMASKIKLDASAIEYLNLNISNELKRKLNISTMENIGYGQGWFLSKYRGYQVKWHGGSFFGIESVLILIPDLGFSTFIQINANIFMNEKKYDKVIRIIALITVDLLLDSRSLVTGEYMCKLFESETGEVQEAQTLNNLNMEYDFSDATFPRMIGEYTHRAFGAIRIRKLHWKDYTWLPYLGKIFLVFEYGPLLKGLLIKTKANCKAGNFFPEEVNKYNSQTFEYFGFYISKGDPFWFISPILIVDMEENFTIYNDTCHILIQRNLLNRRLKLQTHFLDYEIIEFDHSAASKTFIGSFFIISYVSTCVISIYS